MSKNSREIFTDEYFKKAGMAMGDVDNAMQGYRNLVVEVTGLSIRGPVAQGGEFLCTVRGYDEEGMAVVAFHGAATLTEMFIGLSARLNNGSLKWREDQYARK
jgi:hypothetical protein